MASNPTPTVQNQVGSPQGAERFDAKSAPGAATTTATSPGTFLMPPQGAGAPQRLYSTGSPANVERLNVAMQVLRDPMARASFNRPYSGQVRNWNQ